MDEKHFEKHENISLTLEKLMTSFNLLATRFQEMTKEQQETRNSLEAAMRILGYEYSQDAKRWVTREKLEALRKKDD